MTLPPLFVERTRNLLGAEWNQFSEALQTETPVSVRLNKAKLSENLSLGKVPWCESGYYLPRRPVFTLDPLFHAGVYYVQEASSMFLEQIVRQCVDEPVRALDLCAAPGGKSTHLTSLLPKGSLLVSNEYVRQRAHILSENLIKWGFNNNLVCNNTPEELGRLSSFFDVMLVDAPCSGEGMFRKDEGAIAEWSVENVENCVARQRSLLSDVWSALKQDGILIYSTCTYNRNENEETVQWIIDELGAELLSVKLDEAWGITATDFGYRFYPHKTKGEGFFISVLRKTSKEQSIIRIKPEKSIEKFSKEQQDLKRYINSAAEVQLTSHQGKMIFVPQKIWNEFNFFAKKLRILHFGTNLGEWKGKQFIPDTALALSVSLNKDACVVADVDWRTAVSFLRTENIVLPNAPLGVILITYKNQPLGWVKNLGNRCNSLFPDNWRIRMAIPLDAQEDALINCEN
jgi:16S rRNA C967 or C1407 C5-methylase (RsmB/RsmF family)/NOL1/NOP2/fmu family ribosome biogenesis protein